MNFKKYTHDFKTEMPLIFQESQKVSGMTFFQEKYKKKEARQKMSKIMFYTEHFHQFQSRFLQLHKHYFYDTL